MLLTPVGEDSIVLCEECDYRANMEAAANCVSGDKIGEQAELHYVCMQLCLKAGFTPASRFNGLRPDNIMALVSLNMGVALLSQNFYEYYKRENTVGVPITPTVSTSIRLIRKKGRKLSRPAQIFWDFINQGSQKTIK